MQSFRYAIYRLFVRYDGSERGARRCGAGGAAWSVSLMMALAVLADGRVGGRRCPPCRPRRQRAEFLLAASILAVLPIISALPALAQSGGMGGTSYHLLWSRRNPWDWRFWLHW